MGLLALELDTRWMRDERGRLLHARTDDRRPAPLLALGTDGVERVWAVAATAPGGRRAHRVVETAVAYVIEERPAVDLPSGVELRTSADPDAEAVRARLPVEDRGLAAPWVVALVDGEVAAVCETARSTPAAVEAGVWTYERFRRRGLAAAVVAAWVRAVAERTVFYSHDADNDASAGVARRLGARPIGRWWQVHPG